MIIVCLDYIYIRNSTFGARKTCCKRGRNGQHFGDCIGVTGFDFNTGGWDRLDAGFHRVGS